MYKVGPDEKVSAVMAYTQSGLVRGEVVLPKVVRVNTWLRTDSAPEYLRLFKVNWLQFSGGSVRTASYQELLLPVSMVLAFHPAPPNQEPLDYDEREDNRVSRRVMVLMGGFVAEGYYRAAARSDLATTLQILHSPWFSIYSARITSPQLPQMPAISTPMFLVRPDRVSFVPHEESIDGHPTEK